MSPKTDIVLELTKGEAEALIDIILASAHLTDPALRDRAIAEIMRVRPRLQEVKQELLDLPDTWTAFFCAVCGWRAPNWNN